MIGKYKNKKTGEIIEVYKFDRGWVYYRTSNKSMGMMNKSFLKEEYKKIS